MKIVKRGLYIFSIVLLCSSCVSEEYKAFRGARQAIAEGNKNYEAENYPEASENYDKAIEYVHSSLPAHFNSALSGLRSSLALADSVKAVGMANAYARFDSIAESVKSSPEAAMSYYNMGNIMYSQQKIDESIELYKRALRINPDDSVARRNLRIAQLNRKPQDKNGGGGDNDKDKDNQDQQKNQDKQNQDKKQDEKKENQNQQPQSQQQKPQQPQEKLNQGAGDKILRQSQNKENEVRRQMYKNAARQDVSRRHRIKNW